jgi:hypothetical protein
MHTRNIWGTDGNDIVYPLADSFTALLAGLFDDAQRTGHTYWHRPGLAHLERKLEI